MDSPGGGNPFAVDGDDVQRPGLHAASLDDRMLAWRQVEDLECLGPRSVKFHAG